MEWVGGGPESSSLLVTWLASANQSLGAAECCFIHITKRELYHFASEIQGLGELWVWNWRKTKYIYILKITMYIGFPSGMMGDVLELNNDDHCSTLWIYFIVRLLSHVWLFATPWAAAHEASLSSPSPGVCSDSRPLSWWCHPTMSSSVVPFSSCPQSFPAAGSFLSQLFASGGQSTGSSTSVPSNEYSGLISFRIDWFDLLAAQGTLKSLLHHHSSKAAVLIGLIF